MIAFDTNVLVRLAVQDDKKQAEAAVDLYNAARRAEEKILISREVLLETTWVLESRYGFLRKDIVEYLEKIISTDVFCVEDVHILLPALEFYREKGDFSDHLILQTCLHQGVDRLYSFDRGLQKSYPGFVVEPSAFS
jgi:predicted nucleic-acid-binding protein